MLNLCVGKYNIGTYIQARLHIMLIKSNVVEYFFSGNPKVYFFLFKKTMILITN